MLEDEAKKMEEKLEVVKKMMELEKEKRQQIKKNTVGGSMWRSAATNKQIKGYSDMVLQKHRETQPNLPPTTMVMGKENQSAARQGSGQGPRQTGQIPSQTQQNAPNKGQTAAANNLNKAMKEQSEEYKQVEEFLAPIQLLKYKDVFIDNGVEDLEIILELDEKHLEQMSVPLGHKLKIMKRIKELRKSKGMSIPESRQGQRAAQADNVQSNVRAVTKNEYEELPEPNANSGGVGTENNEKKSSMKQGTNKNSSLLEGQYDEGQSHQQFLEALNAWRNAGKPEDQKVQDKSEKKVRFNDDPGEEKKTSPQKKTNFLLNAGNDEGWNVNCLPQYEEKEIKPDPKLTDKKYQQKESCWNCYKLFPQDETVFDEHTKRNFCSKGCYQIHLDSNTIKCQLPDCENRLFKVKGHFIHGKWFCSVDCSEKDPETKELKEMLERGIEFNNEGTFADYEDDEEDVEIDL